MLHASQNRYGSITAKAGRELVCLVALGQQPWLSPVSVPKFSPKKAIPCINAASIRQVAHSNRDSGHSYMCGTRTLETNQEEHTWPLHRPANRIASPSR